MTTSLYCPTCGAANAEEDRVCFACQQPLALQIAEQQADLLQQRYQMLKQVGAGGFGAVYKARDTHNQNRLVAIKQINLRGLSPQEIIDATDGFNREVQIMSRLSHPHLPRFHTQFTDPEHWYVVMDFIEGETLETYLRDITSARENAIRALVLDEILDIGLQLCDVLAYLHTRQPPIVFRDLKPANLLRTPRGQLYLIDFGIARYFKPGQSKDTSPLGSPGYAAPEQYGRAQTDGRADIYSLGALLHHLLSRSDPSENPFLFAPLPASASVDQRELAALVTRMVAADPDQRPANIIEVQQILQHVRARLASAEPRIWRPAPGQTPPPAFARSTQVQQQVMARAVPNQAAHTATAKPKKKSRRTFLKAGLSVGGSLALVGVVGGLAYWKTWHPSGLALADGYPHQLPMFYSSVSAIEWSPDGLSLAFGFNNGTIMGYDPTNKVSIFQTEDFPTGVPVKDLAWSPDGTYLLVVPVDGQAYLWGIQNQSAGESTLSLTSDNTSIQAIAWSPNGLQFASLDDRMNLQIYDSSSDQLASPGPIYAGTSVLAWSPDGTRIATMLPTNANGSSTLQIWDVANNQNPVSIPTDLTAFTNLAWSPDGQSIAILGIDGTLQLWNKLDQAHPDQSQVFATQIDTQQAQLAWSPNGHFLATIDDTNKLLVLDRSNGSTIASTLISDSSGRGLAFPGHALAWLDGQHILVASNQMECWLWSLNWF